MQRYKRVITLFLQSLAAALILSACSKDTADVTVPAQEPPVENTYCISFAIRSVYDAPGSRASGDFADGTDDNLEHAIGTNGNFAFFFDGDEKLFTVSLLSMTSGHEEPAEDNIEARYWTRFNAVDDRLPEYCLVVLNGQSLYDGLSQLPEGEHSIDDILGLIWSEAANPYNIGRSDNGLFTMTNSVYVDENGELQAAVKVEEHHIQKVEPYDPDRALTVYVERMVSKFSFIVSPEANTNDGVTFTAEKENDRVLSLFTGIENGRPVYEHIPWRVRITGWSINALETGTRLFKKINTGANYFSGWNDAANYRSYWSEDPHYSGTYPSQYRKAVNSGLAYYEKIAGEGANVLLNYSYDDLNDGNIGKVVYTPENTYDTDWAEDTFGQRAHSIAGTHLIICAELETDIDGSGTFRATDLYRDRFGTYYKTEKDCFKMLAWTLNGAAGSQKQMPFTRYEWNGTDGGDGTRLTSDTSGESALYLYDRELTDAVIESQTGPLTIPAEIKDGDGKRMLWTDGLNMRNDGAVLNIYDNAGGTARKADDDDIKSLILEWFGAVDHFSDGKMYYHSPVQNPLRGSASAPYGVVRNNWYQFTLNKINSVGTSVDMPQDPIVANTIRTFDQLSVSIDIFGWHEFTATVPSPF